MLEKDKAKLIELIEDYAGCRHSDGYCDGVNGDSAPASKATADAREKLGAYIDTLIQ